MTRVIPALHPVGARRAVDLADDDYAAAGTLGKDQAGVMRLWRSARAKEPHFDS